MNSIHVYVLVRSPAGRGFAMSDSAFTNTLRMGRRLFHIDDLARLPMIFEAVAQVKRSAAREVWEKRRP